MEKLPEKIRRLKEEIAELKARWPAHSVQAWQVQRLEELEEELADLQARQETSGAPQTDNHLN